MAYVRSRITQAEMLSTALVEAYRDKQGRPRQRLLANLHGEPTELKALAKLIFMMDTLSAERDELAPQVEDIMSRRHNERTPDERLVLTRYVQIVNKQVALQKDGVVINQHCTATPDELEAAVQAHAQEARNAASEVLGRSFMHHQELKQAKAKLRRLMS
jgi:formyltetrahydrofolate hydrolase